MAEVIRDDMDDREMLEVMAEGNTCASEVLSAMLESAPPVIGWIYVFLLDSLEIRGSKIETLYTQGCAGDLNKLFLMLDAQHCGIFPRAIIHANLARQHVVPFVDDSIETPSGEGRSLTSTEWQNWTADQADSFLIRYAADLTDTEVFRAVKDLIGIRGNVTEYKAIEAVTSNDAGAESVLTSMLWEPPLVSRWFDIFTLDAWNIKGEEIWILYKYGCEENLSKLLRTLKMFRSGIFPRELVYVNLGCRHTVPFIDDSIALPESMFSFASTAWQDWAAAQRESFIRRHAASITDADLFGEASVSGGCTIFGSAKV